MEEIPPLKFKLRARRQIKEAKPVAELEHARTRDPRAASNRAKGKQQRKARAKNRR